MSARLFCKHGWQYDTDCRLEKTSVGAQVVIAPAIAPLPGYSREPGCCRRIHPVSNPGSFRRAYLGKAVRWLRRLTQKSR
jgi:hypothetical protein